LNNLSHRELSRKAIGWLLKWRHPFWWLPDVPSEQDEAYRRIWQHLRQVSSVADGRHDTEEWRGKQGDFVMCCVRIPSDALSSSLDQVRETLRTFPYVRIHPKSFLHITVQELGFLTDEPRRRGGITREWLDEFIGQAENPIGEYAPFTISLGGINSFVDAVFLDVHDGGWLSRIHGRLIDFVSVPPSNRYAYLPIATIGHYTESAPIGNLVAALTPWRDQIFGRFRAESIDIVKLRTGVPYPDMELIHRFELGRQQRLLEIVQGNTSAGER
jgi:2'-5' RNA ligase